MKMTHHAMRGPRTPANPDSVQTFETEWPDIKIEAGLGPEPKEAERR